MYQTSNCHTGKKEEYHVNLIHPFYYDEHEVDPTELAMHDDELVNIESVVDHKFIGNRKVNKDNLELKIKFEGDENAEWNSWIKEYNHIHEIQQYLRQVGLKNFLLPQYR